MFYFPQDRLGGRAYSELSYFPAWVMNDEDDFDLGMVYGYLIT